MRHRSSRRSVLLTAHPVDDHHVEVIVAESLLDCPLNDIKFLIKIRTQVTVVRRYQSGSSETFQLELHTAHRSSEYTAPVNAFAAVTWREKLSRLSAYLDPFLVAVLEVAVNDEKDATRCIQSAPVQRPRIARHQMLFTNTIPHNFEKNNEKKTSHH